MEADPYHGPAAEDGDAAAVQTRSPGDIVEGAPRAHAGSGDDGAAPSSEWFGGQQVSDGPIDQEDATINTIDDSSIHSGPAAATIVPPYWQNVPSRRRPSTHSSDSGRPPAGAILLLDNEADEGEEERNNACWARSVEIVDHTVVNGGATNIGAFVVWNVRVETLQVGELLFASARPVAAAGLRLMRC
ncbi:sorting nexin-like protein [Cordyceps fumosorosea ARSEF 2679]|uniref:Sorting nexin-like protein n=1 Tax=Cordyceps fumosorosea (strain ARSEF 2679) TaxID=1081104 RepID=A0A167V5T6_CORFA|nr:sorting nexin-like protein [Cordyceps fumosorosea ARSEF 2679]OAA62256.1 sorting nexin-like protein [Cordyceps fumosorosea ARSEF 2679]